MYIMTIFLIAQTGKEKLGDGLVMEYYTAMTIPTILNTICKYKIE